MTINGQDFPFEESTITAIQQAFFQSTLTCKQLVDYYLNRIETLNPILRAVVEVNPDARSLAAIADEEREKSRQNGRVLGALHGIPVLVKDTIGTKDKMGTTAGSYALVGSVVARDATVVERLRNAGAIILGKTSLSEWYKIRSIDHLPNGWCARSGQGVDEEKCKHSVLELRYEVLETVTKRGNIENNVVLPSARPACFTEPYVERHLLSFSVHQFRCCSDAVPYFPFAYKLS